MSEIWGCYSVDDHLASRAFLADLMLYDRLVIPIPIESERSAWEVRGGNPARQEHLLNILGGRAVPVPWTPTLRVEMTERLAMAGLIGERESLAPGSEAFSVTKEVLAEAALGSFSRPPPGVIPVAACDSPDILCHELGLSELKGSKEQYQSEGALMPGVVAAVIGREFLVPNDPRKSDDDLLRIALALSSDNDFCRKRAAYWEWQNRFLTQEMISDQSKLNAALAEMADLVEEEKAVVRTRRIRLGASCAFAVGAAAAGVFAGPIAPCVIGGAFLSVGGWVFDHATDASRRPGPAAMCYSAERAFGWKSFRNSD